MLELLQFNFDLPMDITMVITMLVITMVITMVITKGKVGSIAITQAQHASSLPKSHRHYKLMLLYMPRH